ncbi:MAG TPA: hypothetical protein VNT20_01510 [Flavisolibacter sp.]|jgi:hypothetical protein|nr:hypothetical protein [Flavisolibacter sp.]
MKRLLYFKHWQLFLLIVICGAWVSPSPLRELINSVAITTFLAWIYSIGFYGQDRIVELGLKSMNLKLFKTNVIIVAIMCLIGLVYSVIANETNDVASSGFGLADILLLIASFYFVFTFFYSILFVCKTIAKVEYRREVSFSDYFDYFFFMVSVIVGIWVLQPKVNRLIASKEETLYEND